MPDDNASGIVSKSAAGTTGTTADAKLIERAVAHVTPAGNSQVMGTITFRKQATGLEIHVVLDGLKPGDHGLHVHEKGDCSSMDAMSAGDHFNPGNQVHGGRESAQRHAGDFGNVNADAAGHVDVTFTDTHVALSGDTSILGRAIVVHADKDDGMSQPSGNSGERIACGVIEEDKGASAGG
jgi:Cu-Zn family superoxide dismutase